MPNKPEWFVCPFALLSQVPAASHAEDPEHLVTQAFLLIIQIRTTSARAEFDDGVFKMCLFFRAVKPDYRTLHAHKLRRTGNTAEGRKQMRCTFWP